jgi:uncharacterized protein YndB with AHSA1/START domain
MSDRIERDVVVPAAPAEVWEVLIGDGWLADEVCLDLVPGGDASFRTAQTVRTGWVEEVQEPNRLAFWWAADEGTATRVELSLEPLPESRTRVRVVETRPLDVLDLVGIPLRGLSGRAYGPALLAA